jgi:hypothetical protein
MRLLLSLFLTSFIYSLILGFFAYVILKKRETPQRVVFVHQVIKKSKKKQLPKISKKSAPKSPKKIATNSKFSKGGEEDIKFDDIFEVVDYNIKSEPIRQKKQSVITKKRGNFLKEIKKVKSSLIPTYSVSDVIGTQKDTDYISSEFGKVWAQIDTKAGDFISLEINIKNGVINIVVISTNLDTILLRKFLDQLAKIDTKKIKNFSGVINFNVKLKD